MPTSNPQSIDMVQLIIAIAAIIALIQPWLIAGYKRLFKRAKIQCIKNRTMTVYFKDDGLYIYSFFTFVAKNADEVITNAKMVVNKKDKKLYELEWFRFSDPANNSFVNDRKEYVIQSSTIDSYPLYLVNNVPRILTVYFCDFELLKEMSECKAVEDAMTKMLLTKGDYSLDLLLFGSKGQYRTFKYCFSITEDHYELLKRNVKTAFDSTILEKTYTSFNVELKENA